jgi:hypothetical protein
MTDGQTVWEGWGSVITFVLTKHDGRWLIDAFQNTRIAPVQP